MNPYEESMEGVLEQRSELGHIVVSDGDSTVKGMWYKIVGNPYHAERRFDI